MPTVRSYNKRLEALKAERSGFIPVWQDLSDHHLSYRGRFLVSDGNNAGKAQGRDTKQINNTSGMSVRVLAAGMMAGITSPARPWFRLSTGDPTLNDISSVKQWLNDVQVLMYKVFSQSNTYNSLHTLYSELGVFGIGAMGVYEDFENVIWCRPYTVGSYAVGINAKNKVDTFYREYSVSVAQCVKLFGLDNCSNSVQNMWRNGNTESWVQIVHAVEPNDDRDQQSPLASEMPFRSVYYESSPDSQKSDNFLRRSGFKDFPILVPRWDVTSEDTYATNSPGMAALGDTKALQLGERRMYQSLDKLVNPPLQGPSTLKNKMRSGGLKPGDVVWTDGTGAGLSSIYEFRPDLSSMVAVNDRTELRIKRAFYEDLFLMLAGSDRRQITAREVAEKQGEKLLQLGPVLERLHNELLDPLIDRTFSILQQSGVLPAPPQELQDRELNVEYVSVLAQAQRMLATDSLERVSGFAAQLSTVWPDARHKVNVTQMIDDYSEAIGVNPRVIRSDDEVSSMIQAEQQQAAAAQAAAQGEQMANIAKTVSETSTDEGNVLGEIIKNTGVTDG